MKVQVKNDSQALYSKRTWLVNGKVKGIAEWCPWYEKAADLRKQGCSYEEIAQLIGIDTEMVAGFLQMEAMK